MGREQERLTARRTPFCLSVKNGDGHAEAINATPDRTIFLAGDVAETSISAVMAQMMVYASQSPDPIYLVISTYGGNVHDMFGLYDLMKIINCPVRTVGLGKIMSAGVLLLAAGQRGYRMLGKSATVMAHPVTGGVAGNTFALAAETSEMKRIQRRLESALSHETNMTPEQMKKMMRKGHDVYMDPKEALSLGLCDKLIGADFIFPKKSKQ